MSIEEKIELLANEEEIKLLKKVEDRVIEMELDDDGHYLIYNVLGVGKEEGKLIDVYQNKGRFLYKYAGAFVENCAKLCFKEKFGEDNAKTVKILNPIPNSSPKKFEIDCLVNNKDAYEIKWRDATTDGDHISKEHRRLTAVSEAGFTPIRLMFFPPNRTQAIKIQKRLKDIYESNSGIYYSGEDAWDRVKMTTGIDLYSILTKIAIKKVSKKDVEIDK